MAQSRFLIAPLNTGLETDLKPWLIPDDAFSLLNNAYIFRGRVRKRVGSFPMGNVSANQASIYSRLRIKIGKTNGTGALGATTVPGVVFGIGQSFSVGEAIFTVNATGTPANMLCTTTATGTYNTTTGSVTITGADSNTDVFFYPSTPVMGLLSNEIPDVNFEPVIGFDTQFAYSYASGWDRLGTAIWTGSDSQFFWGITYRGDLAHETYFFVTNYNAADKIKYLKGSTWYNFSPTINAAGDTVETSRLIISFKDRLLLLNTVEKISGVNQTFVNRCRFSWNGSALDAQAWREDQAGKGGYRDAPTKEAIISAEILKDRLIVFFERSTYELVWNGNEILPFSWQQINVELGAESTFSIVPFDKVIFGIGNVGIHACNGINVERIDQKIPSEVFQIRNDQEGLERVYGIRDYYDELVYWTFPASDKAKYPSRVLVYNYRTGSWAYNNDTITCFGYFQTDDRKTWSRSPEPWEEAIYTWDAGSNEARFLSIIAGNQQGYTFVVSSNTTRNAPSLFITNWVNNDLTIINHNLFVGNYIYIEDIPKGFKLVAQVTAISGDTVTIDSSLVGAYEGGLTAALISQISIKTKQYNFFKEAGRNFTINKVEFLVDSTSKGEIGVNTFIASGRSAIDSTVLQTSPYPIYPQEADQDRLWHPIYLSADGSFIQLQFFMSDEEMRDTSIAFSDFQLHAMLFHATQTSSYIT